MHKKLRRKGTAFSICQPKYTDKKGKNNMARLSFTPFNGNEKVLLIDDEKPILSMVTQMLKRFGYHVSPYDKSADALSCFESSPYEFDIVITDLTMPDITGDEIVSRIKSIRKDIPVILCTGFSEKMVDTEINGPKPDKVLMKPSGKDEILNIVRMLLDESKQSKTEERNKNE